jgi:hypothetical protein
MALRSSLISVESCCRMESLKLAAICVSRAETSSKFSLKETEVLKVLLQGAQNLGKAV